MGYINFFWWLSVPLSWWLKVQLVADKSTDVLKANTEDPVLYALPHRSISDLLVLYIYCKKLGLPIPSLTVAQLSAGKTAAYLYLSKLGIFQPKRSGAAPPPLQKLCARLEAQKNLNVQIVPVSIMWGRNPGREENSLFKLLFPDDEHAGLLQKFFIILAQGRNVVMHFGEPISLREQVDQGPSAEQVARKIRRVLRVHFRTQRNITLGPKKYDRAAVIRQLFQSRAIQQAIDAEAKKTGQPRQRVERKARYYLREISSAQNYSMIRFFDIMLTWVWTKIYDGIIVHHADQLRTIANDHEIVYLSAHRSHVDYLVMPYDLYYRGLATPHIVAGINLAFWPLGPILRRCGAFFIRRSFRGNRLYSICVTESLNFLITKGHSLTFFPEGGRSRSGRLLQPRTGMLSMVVQSYLRDPSRPIAFIPVYIGYDKVAEVKSYLSELRGAKKKSENLMELLQVWRVLQVKHGKAYLGFGEPLYINDFLDRANAQWRTESSDYVEQKPKWLTKLVHDIAVVGMKGVNDAALVGPVSLVSLILLSSPQRALAEEELHHMINVFRKILALSARGKERYLPDGTPAEIVAYSEKIAPFRRFDYPDGGQVVYLNEVESSLVTYYRNNVLHLIVVPALIAAHFQHHVEVGVEDMVASCVQLYPFLAQEFFLNYDLEEAQKEIHLQCQEFVKLELISRAPGNATVLQRAPVTSQQFATLRIIARALGSSLERYGLAIALVSSRAHAQGWKIEELESTFFATSQRIAQLNGVADPEIWNKTFFKNFVDVCKTTGMIEEVGESRYRAQASMLALQQSARRLLGEELYSSINEQAARKKGSL